MWMLMGLIGMFMAGGVADAFVRQDAEADGDLADQDGTDTGEPGHAGRYLDLDNLPGPGDAPVPRDDWAGEWEDDEYISRDTPEPDPEPRVLRLGDDGGQLSGDEGDDTLLGGDGADTLRGGPGDDELNAGGGDDSVIGGSGGDLITGGDGNDSLDGWDGDDMLIGGDGDDVLVGGDGQDSLFGGAGDDTLQGGWGDDLLVAGSGGNLLIGGDGNDTLIGFHPGENGDDDASRTYLNGGDGHDLIVVGAGDVASGGSGGDTFILGDWLDSAAPAEIMDFDPSQDRLVLAYSGLATLPELTITTDAETGSAQVHLNGDLVALVHGSGELTTDMIALEPVFPEGADAPLIPAR
ncbi:MAG: Hemolysin-type calcium-binding repeat (2 copies) [Rhodobacteraceae bacterium HLUCCA12]|nr:MAG: Hemolysin-type calcium-binding repeat (2 copies) [Rhodobacteraceae bacterium HLUCCA12]